MVSQITNFQDLTHRLSQEISGKFKDVVLMSFLDRAHLNAKALFKALDGAGTKEDVIIQVLCTASNEEIAELRDAYEHSEWDIIAIPWVLLSDCTLEGLCATLRLFNLMIKQG